MSKGRAPSLPSWAAWSPSGLPHWPPRVLVEPGRCRPSRPGVTEQGSPELPDGRAGSHGSHSLQKLDSGLAPGDTNRSDEFLGSRVLDFQES